MNNFTIEDARKAAKELINTLSFDKLAEIVDDFDDLEMFNYILDRMEQLDKERFLEFAENY